jgi:hypothetical protein
MLQKSAGLCLSVSFDRWRNRDHISWKKLDHILVWFVLLHAWPICMLQRSPYFFPITTQVCPRFATGFGYFIDKEGWNYCRVWIFSHSKELNCLHETAWHYQFSFSLSLHPSITVSVEYFWTCFVPPTTYTSLSHLIHTSSLNPNPSH